MSKNQKPQSKKQTSNLPDKVPANANKVPVVAKKQQGALILRGTAISDYKENLPEIAEMFDVNDNIRGVKGKLPQIKIAHQVNLYQDATGATFKEFEGIILHHSAANAWWLKPFNETGGGDIPNCFSMDAFSPEGDMLQSKNCVECPKNQFKTAVGKDGEPGRGKACKNMWRLHVLVDGQVIPKRLTLPPSNTGGIQEFLVGLRDRNIPYILAIVKFGLKPSKNKDNISYSTVTYELKAVITDKEVAKQLKVIKDSFADSFGQAITHDETGE